MVFLVALSVAEIDAAPGGPSGVTRATPTPATAAVSPERTPAERAKSTGTTSSLRVTIELIVLAATLAIAIAFYSATFRPRPTPRQHRR